MQLSRKTIAQLNGSVNSLPADAIFELPEKVLQFGTGVLLRGLPDYYIDKANKQGIFNGRIVVVKSTDSGAADAFDMQDGLYTQCIRGIQDDKEVEDYIINASISRVLSARSQWQEVMACAANPDLEVVISNTTEVGIVLLENENINGNPPASFPGKLLAFLYQRFKVFNGDMNKGLVILPTELITDNGTRLQSIIMELAHRNDFDYVFLDWLENANEFCNTLVDRIVPGKLPSAQHLHTEKKLGYHDDLMIMSEVYSLWAIETVSKKVNEVLSFAKADSGVVITDNINKHRELKLRLLNGTHTFSSGLACLAGFDTVKSAMDNRIMGLYIYDLMVHEIAPCIVKENLSSLEAHEFASRVIERFRNPALEHNWVNITLQISHKMKLRNVPLILAHYGKNLYVPGHMAIGFAAYLVFMKCEPGESGKYYGEFNGNIYPVDDTQAGYFHRLWQSGNLKEVVKKTLSNQSLWGTDLSTLPGFAFAVELYADSILQKGVLQTLNDYQLNREKVESHEA